MDKPLAIRKLKSLRRHIEGIGRGVDARVEDLIAEYVPDGDRLELQFLTKTLQPPIAEALRDLVCVELLVAEASD